MTVHVCINGKVQGVYFRGSAKEKADALQIVGWIKNMPNGSVELVAKGTEKAIKEFIEWCHQGPKGAVVSTVEVTEEPEEIKLGKFLIAR